MERFTRLCGVAAPILAPNIDTGMLAHSQWCRDHPTDLGNGLFRDWRFDESGAEKPEFVLNRPRYREATILIAGPNFGCGSSRETAVWALMQFGIRCVIASSFGDIFRDNAYQNGLLPVVLPEPEVEALAALVEAMEAPAACVDLEQCVIEVAGRPPTAFAVAPDRRAALLDGIDETTLMRLHEAAIAAFQAADRDVRPWIYLRPNADAGERR